MFAIYACAITTLSEDDCEVLMGVAKAELQERYYGLSQKALTRAGILGTKDIVVLQAAMLLLVCELRPSIQVVLPDLS